MSLRLEISMIFFTPFWLISGHFALILVDLIRQDVSGDPKNIINILYLSVLYLVPNFNEYFSVIKESIFQ
jgi:hypothetical protein